MPKGGSGRHNWGSIEDEPQLEADAEYDEELEIEGGPQAQNRWTGGAEPVPVDDEDGQRTRRVAAHSETEGELHYKSPCTYPAVTPL